MQLTPSRLLHLLREGALPTVLKFNLTEPRAVEIAALGGVDAVWLCMEHVPNDWIGLENQVPAARLCPPLPELVAEGFRVFNVGADVVGLGQYVRQRVELVLNQAKALATGAAPGVRSPYA